MNRLTAIGLASLVAYGLLIASKYSAVMSATREEKAPRPPAVAVDPDAAIDPAPPEAAARPVVAQLAPLSISRMDAPRASAVAVEFRQARDLKAFADGLMARKPDLTSDERYHLAKALEECLFATSLTEDIGTYAAKQRRQFMAGLPINDPNNAKRIAAYEAVDNTQRCARFQGTKISQKDVDDLFQAAAQQGDARAQARILVAELNKSLSSTQRAEPSQSQNQPRVGPEDLSRLI